MVADCKSLYAMDEVNAVRPRVFSDTHTCFPVPTEVLESDGNGVRLRKDSRGSRLSRHSSFDKTGIPQIRITENESLSKDGLARPHTISEANPSISIALLGIASERNGDEDVFIQTKMYRSHSAETILSAGMKLNHKSKKKFPPLFWHSKNLDSTDCEDKKSGSLKAKSPNFKRFRGASDPHVDPGFLRDGNQENKSFEKATLQPSKSLVNIRSPFASRKQYAKFATEDEKKKIYIDMLHCIRNSDCKGLKTLIKKCFIDVNMVNGKESLLHDASYMGCTKCIKTLIKNGSRVSLCDDSGWTALHAAVLARSIDAVKLLLEHKASPNILSSDGLSPCHLAVITGDLYITHEIVKGGGDPLIKNSSGVTPFQLAIDLKKSIVLDYFLHMPCFLVN